jgi:two-component system, chemotaxis family, protein-glutamate methylesterase/glutaminase
VVTDREPGSDTFLSSRDRRGPVDDFPVVALVCSAGGLDALTRVLEPLPAGLPAAVLVLQHLSPEHPSELAAILNQRTALPVIAAADGTALAPCRVLVSPAGQHTLITADETIALIPSGSLPPYRPSADLLLTTLAVAAGDRVIAVVLSGRGNDAATGATAVHHFGGTVIVSTADTSAYTAMPQATIDRDNTVDHVVAVDDIATLLIALTTAPAIAPARKPSRSGPTH